MQHQSRRKWHRRGVIVLGGLVLTALLWTAAVRHILQWEFRSAIEQAVEIDILNSRSGNLAVLLPGAPLFQAVMAQGGNLDLRSPFINYAKYMGSSGYSWLLTIHTETRTCVFELFDQNPGQDIFSGADGVLSCTADLTEMEETVLRPTLYGTANR